MDKHPGTRDVNLLFSESYSKDDMATVLKQFLDFGYFVSAKHDFQLCRAIVLGKQTYIQNVNLLHPAEAKMNKVDFVEIMDLDVTGGSFWTQTASKTIDTIPDKLINQCSGSNFSLSGFDFYSSLGK